MGRLGAEQHWVKLGQAVSVEQARAGTVADAEASLRFMRDEVRTVGTEAVGRRSALAGVERA